MRYYFPKSFAKIGRFAYFCKEMTGNERKKS